jgi:hypothetical protein
VEIAASLTSKLALMQVGQGTTDANQLPAAIEVFSAPVGSWRAKSTRPMASLASLFGVTGGVQRTADHSSKRARHKVLVRVSIGREFSFWA